MKKEFYYLSSDGKTKIHTIEWIPEGEVKGILQIAHGMVEYIDRYDEFAEFLCIRGFYVVGNDHLGHGGSITDEKNLGYIGEKDGNALLIKDIRHLHVITRDKYKDKPYFFLGHSMGSFLARQYMNMYSNDLSGVIIMGTGYYPGTLLLGGIVLSKIIAAVKGEHYRSGLINNLGFGGYNKKFENPMTPYDWVTSDIDERTKYLNDPLCTFLFTVNGYYSMFSGMMRMHVKKNNRIRKELPILFTSGSDDAVGEFEKGVNKVYNIYKKQGFIDITKMFYKGERHEIINGVDKMRVFEDIYTWLNKQLR